jgi:hypothetical protein
VQWTPFFIPDLKNNYSFKREDEKHLSTVEFREWIMIRNYWSKLAHLVQTFPVRFWSFASLLFVVSF